MMAVNNNSNYTLSDHEYKHLADIVYSCAGINLGDNKKELVHARLSKILRKRKLSGFREYITILKDDKSGDELVALLDAISTNVTHFFREKEHFNFLIENICKDNCTGNFKFWSAGCSSGEEPYTIAITVLEYLLKSKTSMPQIIATDLSTKVLSKAIAGVYPMKAVENLDLSLVKKYFLKGSGNSAGKIKVKKEVAKMVTFERLNLIEPMPFREEFDVIFCRNVMIYFDNDTRQRIVNGFYNSLKSGGYLIIGHSESLSGIQHSYKYIKPTIYRKP